MSDLVNRFLRLHAYERDCGGSVLTALDSIPNECRREPAGARAINTAAHIQAARLEWHARLTESPGLDELFFEHAEMGLVERLTADADEAWERYMQTLTGGELSRLARYTNMKGQPNQCMVADILTHVFNHGTYHRGQIAMLIAQAMGEPIATDFIFYAYREPELG